MDIINYQELSVNNLIDSILKIDNGYLDNWCDETGNYEYCENMRYNLMDELLRRYLEQRYVGESDELEKAYKLFLRYYI
jgi:hypothetical protein